MFMNPNGVTELVELANPNVIAEYEPINVPQRTESSITYIARK